VALVTGPASGIGRASAVAVAQAGAPVVVAGPRFPLLAPLRVRNFALLWGGNAVSLAGDQFQLVALAILALDVTRSTAVLGGVLAAEAVPRALLMLVGGVAADRFQPRRVLLAATTLQGLLVALLAGALATGHLALWHLFAYAAGSGTALAFTTPATGALVPQLVPRERLRSANALSSLNFNLASAVCAPLAGLVVASTGSLPAFVLNAASFFAAAGAVAAIRIPPPPPAVTRASPLHQAWEGIAAARADPVVWLAIVAAAIFSLGWGGAVLVGLPALATLALDAGSAGVGVLLGAAGVGAAAGAVAMGSLPRLPRPGLVGGAVLLGLGLSLVLVGAAPSVAVAVPVLVAGGLLRAAAANAYITLVQGRAPAATRGRVMALFWLGVNGLAPLSLAAGGAVGAVLGPRVLLAVGGAVVALAGAYSLSQRAFREAT
jgi:hypothetical protein